MESMTGDDQDGDRDGGQHDCSAAREAVADARREAAAALARLAEAAVRYADARIAGETAARLTSGFSDLNRPKPGEFVADELSLLLRNQPFKVRCLLARTRRLANDLPTVWEAFQRGDVDAEQIRVIDRVARRVTEAATLAAIDDQVIEAARTRTPKQLHLWLLRLVVRLEPLAFEERHRRALAERRVTVVQGADGMGYVTGEVSATDAAAIDGTLAAAARSLGADDQRTEQQRRSDLFADLLLGRLRLDDPDESDRDENGEEPGRHHNQPAETVEPEWLEIENIDPDTGELLGTHLQRVDADGEPVGVNRSMPSRTAHPVRQRRWCGGPGSCGSVWWCRCPVCSVTATPRPSSRTDPGSSTVRCCGNRSPRPSTRIVAISCCSPDSSPTIAAGSPEHGRYPSTRLAQAITIRAGTCRYPTCTVPADRCDLDHHEPVPKGTTSGRNMDPFCRRHHRGKT